MQPPWRPRKLQHAHLPKKSKQRQKSVWEQSKHRNIELGNNNDKFSSFVLRNSTCELKVDRFGIPLPETVTKDFALSACNDVKCNTILAKKTKTATWIIHKIRTLFLSRNITRLARWRGWPGLRASLHRSAIKLDFSISHDRNSVLILCIIQVAVFFGQVVVLPLQAKQHLKMPPPPNCLFFWGGGHESHRFHVNWHDYQASKKMVSWPSIYTIIPDIEERLVEERLQWK